MNLFNKNQQKNEDDNCFDEFCEESQCNQGLNKLLQIYTWKPRRCVVADIENESKLIPLNLAVFYKPDGLHIAKYLHETGEIMKSQHESLGYVFYLVDETKNKLFICPNCESEFFSKRFNFNIEIDRTVATHSYRNNEVINVSTLKPDMRFPNFQKIPEIYPTNILAIPMTDFQNKIIGVFEVFRDSCVAYDENESEKFQFLSKWMAEGIEQNKKQVIYKRFNEITNSLIESIDDNFQKDFLKNNEVFLNRLVVSAKSTFDAESVAVFLKNPQNDWNKEITTENLFELDASKMKLRLRKEFQLVKMTLDSNQIINITNVYNDLRFDNRIDFKTGKIIRTILANPIDMQAATNSFGTIQILNKLNEESFTKVDENFMKIFSKYSGLWLHFKSTYEQILNQRILNEIVKKLIYKEWSTPIFQIMKLCSIDETIDIPKNFLSFEFHPFPDHITEISKFIYYMIETTCKETLTSKRESLYDFVNCVRKFHLHGEFTNFDNTFVALHFVYVFIKQFELEYGCPLFNEIEKLALMISVFCCQIDCDGKLPEYIKSKRQNLFELYERNVMEKHQIWLTKLLIDTFELLTPLTHNQQSEILEMIDENLLNIDLQNFIQITIKCCQIIEKKSFDINLMEHRLLIRHLIIKSSIYAFSLKNLSIATKVYKNLVDQINRQRMCKVNGNNESYQKESFEIVNFLLDNGIEISLDILCQFFPFMQNVQNLYKNFQDDVIGSELFRREI